MPVWIEIIKGLFSWPFIILIICFAIHRTYGKEIKDILKNIKSLRFPGGTEIITDQAPPPPEITDKNDFLPSEIDTITITKKLQDEYNEKINVLMSELNATREQRDKLLNDTSSLLEEKSRTINYWYFMFLNCFLALNTKKVLFWFDQPIAFIPNKSKIDYEKYAIAQNIDSQQREIIFNTLQFYDLIENYDESFYRISQKGKDFLNFIKKLGS